MCVCVCVSVWLAFFSRFISILLFCIFDLECKCVCAYVFISVRVRGRLCVIQVYYCNNAFQQAAVYADVHLPNQDVRLFACIVKRTMQCIALFWGMICNETEMQRSLKRRASRKQLLQRRCTRLQQRPNHELFITAYAPAGGRRRGRRASPTRCIGLDTRRREFRPRRRLDRPRPHYPVASRRLIVNSRMAVPDQSEIIDWHSSEAPCDAGLHKCYN